MNDDQNGILAAFFVLGIIFLIVGIVYSLTSLVDGVCLAFIGVFLICFQIFLAERYMKVDEPVKMRILVWGRGAGKTTECSKTLRKNKDSVMFVLNQNMREAVSKELRARVFSVRSRCWRGCAKKKAIIDEADFMSDEELKHIGAYFEVILVATSLGRSYDNPDTWLRRQIMRLGTYEHKVSPFRLDPSMPHEIQDKEYRAVFKGVKK